MLKLELSRYLEKKRNNLPFKTEEKEFLKNVRDYINRIANFRGRNIGLSPEDCEDIAGMALLKISAQVKNERDAYFSAWTSEGSASLETYIGANYNFALYEWTEQRLMEFNGMTLKEVREVKRKKVEEGIPYPPGFNNPYKFESLEGMEEDNPLGLSKARDTIGILTKSDSSLLKKKNTEIRIDGLENAHIEISEDMGRDLSVNHKNIWMKYIGLDPGIGDNLKVTEKMLASHFELSPSTIGLRLTDCWNYYVEHKLFKSTIEGMLPNRIKNNKSDLDIQLGLDVLTSMAKGKQKDVERLCNLCSEYVEAVNKCEVEAIKQSRQRFVSQLRLWFIGPAKTTIV